jgi:hypothetical protein
MMHNKEHPFVTLPKQCLIDIQTHDNRFDLSVHLPDQQPAVVPFLLKFKGAYFI